MTETLFFMDLLTYFGVKNTVLTGGKMEFNRFYRIIRDKYITYAAAVEDFELLNKLSSISHEQANYLFRTLLITEDFKKAIIELIEDK